MVTPPPILVIVLLRMLVQVLLLLGLGDMEDNTDVYPRMHCRVDMALRHRMSTMGRTHADSM